MTTTPRQSSPTEKGQGITIHDLPIGTRATGVRQESDSMGTIAVPAEHYWGARRAAT